MAQIILHVSDHRVSVDNSVMLAQDSNEYDSIKFIFDSTWDGFSRSAILYQKINDPIAISLTDDMCYIPSYVLKYNSPLYIGARGIQSSDESTKRVTTQMISFQVASGAIRGNNSTSEEIGSDEYKTLMSILNGKVDINQGINYAGKYLGIDSSGNVKPMDIQISGGINIKDDGYGNIELY